MASHSRVLNLNLNLWMSHSHVLNLNYHLNLKLIETNCHIVATRKIHLNYRHRRKVLTISSTEKLIEVLTLVREGTELETIFFSCASSTGLSVPW